MREAARRYALLAALLSSVATLVWMSGRVRAPTSPPARTPLDVGAPVSRVDAWLRDRWASGALEPAPEAEPLAVLRRLTLALVGSVPSLEEVRIFERDVAPDRIARWTLRLLEDPRASRYLAERLARALVGIDGGTFLVYRRDRLVEWLAAQLEENRPYDAWARELIAAGGRWTEHPASNFITHAVQDGEVDEDVLAGRTLRTFLGQRMDCAQCHDHPFGEWTQSQFAGVAAFYASARLSLVGVDDGPAPSGGAPGVPFGSAWLPSGEAPRARLAAWVTHRDNRRFRRAIVNRVFSLLYGRPLSTPIDDLPDPPPSFDHPLDVIAEDFLASGHDLRRLIVLLTSLAPFRLESRHEHPEAIGAWAAFPMTALRPEQVVGAILQSSSISTIDLESHFSVRVIRWLREKEFVQEYGDLGESELENRPGTIPQALLRMNGKLSTTLTQAEFFGSVGRIARFARADADRLEALYLTYLTRRPSAAEREYFEATLAQSNEAGPALEDIAWVLLNTAEFSWNH